MNLTLTKLNSCIFYILAVLLKIRSIIILLVTMVMLAIVVILIVNILPTKRFIYNVFNTLLIGSDTCMYIFNIDFIIDFEIILLYFAWMGIKKMLIRDVPIYF